MSFLLIDYDKSRDCGIIKSDFLSNIREHFSIKDDKAGLKKHLFKLKFLPTRLYIITEQGRFEMGLLVEIIKYLKSLNTPFKIVFSEEFKQRYHSAYPFAKDELATLTITPYPYQVEAVRALLTNGNGIVLVPTGGGKTAIMALLLETVYKNNPKTQTLVLTLTNLIEQTYNEFIKFGMDPKKISKWSGGNELNTDSEIVICGYNILYSKIENVTLELKKAKIAFLKLNNELTNDPNIPLDKKKKLQSLVDKIGHDITLLKNRIPQNKKVQDYLSKIGLLIIDEIHTVKKGNEITNLLGFIKTRNKFGMTGTLPESLIDQWHIIGNIGPIVYEAPRDQLVADKRIADVDVRILKLFYKTSPELVAASIAKSDPDNEEEENINARYQNELSFIRTSDFRNNTIRKCCEKLDKNILIPVEGLEHGEYLKTFLANAMPNKQVFFIQGSVENDVREQIKTLMEKDNNIICIAISRIFSTGINIKNLHYILLVIAGKAKIRLIQTIGRGVRMLDDKVKIVIIDLADQLHYGTKHLEKRLEIYDNENFKYQIIPIYESPSGSGPL